MVWSSHDVAEEAAVRESLALGHDQKTEGEGFEPSSEETPKTAFKAAAFNRSATPPRGHKG